MSLTCECNHFRKDHQSGKDRFEDGSVSSCMIKDCACKNYHANYESRLKKRKILLKSFLWSGLLLVGAIITGIIGQQMINFSVDSVLNDYTITPKFHTVHKYLNGTITNSTNYYDNEKFDGIVKDAAFFPVMFILLPIGMFGAFFIWLAYYELENRKLVRE